MKEKEIVSLCRDVKARLVPSGTEVTLQKNWFVTISQSLGASYTVICRGNMLRIEGRDADALGKEPPAIVFKGTPNGPVVVDDVWLALKQVFDPEIPVNIVDLGLVYEVSTDGASGVSITMTLTSPGCGMGPVITDDAHRSVMGIPNVESVNINMVFDPPWSDENMTDDAKLELGLI